MKPFRLGALVENIKGGGSNNSHVYDRVIEIYPYGGSDGSLGEYRVEGEKTGSEYRCNLQRVYFKTTRDKMPSIKH